MEFSVYLWIICILAGMFLGDYLVSNIKKIKFTKRVDIVEIYTNIDTLCSKHLANLNFILDLQNKKFVKDGETEDMIKQVSTDIYMAMSVNFREYCYVGITDDELCAHITFVVTKFMAQKIMTINQKK